MDESSVKCVAMFELSWAHYKRVQRIVSELIAFIGAESKSADFHFETQKKKMKLGESKWEKHLK